MVSINQKKKKKERNRWYPPETIIDADYADDLVLPANTFDQSECLLKKAARSIGLSEPK